MKRKALILGAGGNIGVHIARLFAHSYDTVLTVHDYCPEGMYAVKLDITDPGAVEALFAEVKPSVAVNTAAMADPNTCQGNRDMARMVNVDGAANVARACQKSGARLVHFSTDLVFDGKSSYYKETDPALPLSHYGQTKLESEKVSLENNENTAVLRTAIVFGTGSGKRPNFFQMLVHKLKAGEGMNIFTDEYRSFLYVEDCARAAQVLAQSGLTGLVHAGGERRFSRYEFARKVIARFHLPEELIKPCKVADVHSPAPRSADCSLDSGRILGETDWRPEPAETGIEKFVKSMGF